MPPFALRRLLPLCLLAMGFLSAPAWGQMIRQMPPVDAVGPATQPGRYRPPSQAAGTLAPASTLPAAVSYPPAVPYPPAVSYPPAPTEYQSPWGPDYAPAYVPPYPRYAGPAPAGTPNVVPPPVGQPPPGRPPVAQPPAGRLPIGPAPLWPPQPTDHPPGPDRLAVYPGSTAEMLRTPSGVSPAQFTEPPAGVEIPADVRPGAFQKLVFCETYLPKWGTNGFGINELDLKAYFALPCPKPTSPLLIIPGFAVQYLDGPRGVDLAPRIYAAYTEFRWMGQVRPRLGIELSITPGVFSDFEQEAGKAFRLPGHAAAAWTFNDTTKIVFGAAYLDRPDIEVIPIGGVIWKPDEDSEYEMLFPHPKLAHRVYWFGQYGRDVQDWLYLAAEFASESWTLSHADGSIDEAVLRDYRLILGMERRVIGGLDARIELAYAFNREIRFYRSNQTNFDPDDTVMVRLKLLY